MLTIMLCFFIVLYATTGTTSDGKDKGEKGGKGAAASQNPTGPHQGAGQKEGPGGKVGVGPRENAGTLGERNQSQNEDPQKKHLEKVFESLYFRFGPDWTVSNCWVGGPPQLRAASPDPVTPDGGGKNVVRVRRGQAGNEPYRARTAKPGDDMLVAGRICFDESSAEMGERQTNQLRRAVDELAGKVQKIEIRGHTSLRPLPPKSPYHDHWDLAYDRCRKVRDFLVAGGIDPGRIRLGVAANNEPLELDGETVPARNNSRVEIHWLNEYMKNPSGVQDKGFSSPIATR